MDCGLPGSSVDGILQARTLEWVFIPSSRGSSQPKDQIHISYVSYIGRLPLTPRGKPRPFLRPPLLALERGEGGAPQHIQVVVEVRAPLLIPQERGTS